MSAIFTVTELSDILGSEFVIFAGSAISGVAAPRLAMSNAVRDELVRCLSSRACAHLYVDALRRAYLNHLLCNKSLLEETKFEEFLWYVRQASSVDSLNDLLCRLYCCSDGEFGPNHLAIAELIRSGKCCACITTNFDDAIERACKALGVRVRIWDVIRRGCYPNTIGADGCADLIKVHGSARDYTCAAESPVLLAAKANESHGHLRELLANKRVFVVGYSGFGDIDISPHLQQSTAEYLWAVRPGSHSLLGLEVECDLSQTGAGGQNLLVSLASPMLTVSKAKNLDHEAPSQVIGAWLNYVEFNLDVFLTSIFQWRNAKVLAHLQSAQHFSQKISSVELVKLHAQNGVYITALCGARSVKRKLGSSDDIYELCAFALWRLGCFGLARWVLSKSVAVILDHEQSSTFGDAAQRACNLRLYIEICLDLLQLMPPALCLRMAEHWRLKQVDDALSNLAITSPQDNLLTRIEQLHLRWLLGAPVTFESVQDLVEVAKNSGYPNITYVGVRALLQISIDRGYSHFKELHEIFHLIGRWHYLRKNEESLKIARLRQSHPKYRRLIYWRWRVQSSLVYFFRTLFVEMHYRLRSFKWSIWRVQWRRDAIVCLETGDTRSQKS